MINIIYYIFSIIIIKQILSFKLSSYEPVIGNWKLLYSDNIFFENYQNDNNNFDLQIFPLRNDELSVKIKRYETFDLITYTKLVSCKAYQTDCKDLIGCDVDNIDENMCTLLILTAEKNIKSIGIFDFPYLPINYTSTMRPKYFIIYKIDLVLNRLYILFENNIYVFQRDKINKIVQDEKITTNTFFISNFVSFLLGKLLEKTIHLN